MERAGAGIRGPGGAWGRARRRPGAQACGRAELRRGPAPRCGPERLAAGGAEPRHQQPDDLARGDRAEPHAPRRHGHVPARDLQRWRADDADREHPGTPERQPDRGATAGEHHCGEDLRVRRR